MPNQTHSIPKNYNAGDLYDACSIAENDLQWMSYALSDLSKKFVELKKQLNKSHNVPDYYFDQLETFIGMYEYLAEDRLSSHARDAEAYKAEWEADKKGGEA